MKEQKIEHLTKKLFMNYKKLVETYKKNGGIWYIHKGLEGILCYPDEIHHEPNYNMKFVAFRHMRKQTLIRINNKNYKACCTYSDSYAGDSTLSIGCEIDQNYITNCENPNETIFVWETIDELKSDKYYRTLLMK